MNSRRRIATILIVIAAAVLGSSPASAWFDNAWSFRKAITVDSKAAAVDDTLKHYPVLIRLDSSRFNFDDAQKAGQDLRFVDSDDRTVLNYQIESFDSALGLAMIWVDMPELPGGSEHQIWMYYGNKTAQSGADPVKVFDAAYRGVYHFVSGNPGRDSSSAHADIAGVATAAAGAIGAGAGFTGQPVSLPASVNPATGFTLSFWAHEKAPAANAVLYALHGAGALVVGLKQGVPYLEVGGQHVDATVPPLADWTDFAVVGDAGKTTLYVDGKPAATVNAPVPATVGTATLGADGTTPSTAFTGEIDELRTSATARPASLVAADYAAQRAGSPLVEYGADEKASGVGFGYFGIIFRNITPDAWVVIAVLAVMAVLSWLVMWTKWNYVARAARANRVFLARYREQGSNLTALDGALAAPGGKRRLIEAAPIYRVYRIGMAELHARGDLRGRALTGETVAAIRASLDGQQVEENQALDRHMVLLTIAIAGGPFIGLLGTVLGVMITFAAIAAAGDVNVNAIAPGIAAALLATVTGLFVAIPALFGYNYLSTLNADVSAKMQVFADQFVTRLAEVQRDASRAQAAE
ncbi:MAG: DUF2341 domain-containing protein [Rhizomicrobium sp.]